ncbi:hypothetical protein [Phaffia rhodozyma]|uniref:Uncharacterized protein n=1 Tax=Phaffia rhodozyma TaxID=264483 RepID=A0A0F7SF48_PHARH|nr:hypothetical protein [Phaffia rhodozyma]
MPPKRKSQSNASTKQSHTKKRARPTRIAFGATKAEDEIQASAHGPAFRVPTVHGEVKHLSAYCLAVVGRNVRMMFEPDYKGGGLKETFANYFYVLPEHLRIKVWERLLDSGSGLLKEDLISQYFLSSYEIVLRGDLLPVLSNLKSLRSLTFSTSNEHVRRLVLSYLPQVSDTSIADLLRKMPALEYISLRGSSRAEDVSVKAIERTHYKTLRTLILSETNVKLPSLANLLLKCTELQELKLAEIDKMVSLDFGSVSGSFSRVDDLFWLPVGQTDASFNRLLDTLYPTPESNSSISLTSASPIPLFRLTKLKLRGKLDRSINSFNLSRSTLHRLLSHLPSLSSLDISYCENAITSLPSQFLSNLTKLSLRLFTRWDGPSPLVDQLIQASPPLQTLILVNSNILVDGSLGALTGLLEKLVDSGDVGRGHSRREKQLSKVCLIGKMTTRGPIHQRRQRVSLDGEEDDRSDLILFLEKVGRKLNYLDLSGAILGLDDLQVFIPPGSTLTHLVLAACELPDRVGDCLLGCSDLRVLNIAHSRVEPFSADAVHSPRCLPEINADRLYILSRDKSERTASDLSVMERE